MMRKVSDAPFLSCSIRVRHDLDGVTLDDIALHLRVIARGEGRIAFEAPLLT